MVLAPYHTATKKFIPVAASMASPREDFEVGLLSGGKVLLVGGSADGTSPLASAEIFDPSATTFTPASSVGTPRTGPTVLQLPGGKVLVLGGSSGSAAGVTAAETFPN
jgi:hypothetical protein